MQDDGGHQVTGITISVRLAGGVQVRSSAAQARRCPRLIVHPPSVAYTSGEENMLTLEPSAASPSSRPVSPSPAFELCRLKTTAAILLRTEVAKACSKASTCPTFPMRPSPLPFTLSGFRTLRSGGSFTEVNNRPILRDGAGRIYMERWILTPKGSDIRLEMTTIQIPSPTSFTTALCVRRYANFKHLSRASATTIQRGFNLARSKAVKAPFCTRTSGV